MIERVEAHGGSRRGSRYGRYHTVEIGNYNRDNNLSATQLGYHHSTHGRSNSNHHPCPVTLGFDTSLVPWPGIKYSCVRVLELYCKVFDQQELYELIVRYHFTEIFYTKISQNMQSVLIGSLRMNASENSISCYQDEQRMKHVREHLNTFSFFGNQFVLCCFRKTCKNCKCPRDSHDLFHDEWITIRNNLGLTYATDPVQRLTFPRTFPVVPKGFVWAPPTLSIDQVQLENYNFRQ